MKCLFALALIVGMVHFPSHADVRERIRIDDGWRFVLAETPDGALPGCDDHAWRRVTLPHNWGWQEAQRGESYYRGPGWYRRDLAIDSASDGRRTFLRVEAASSVADVFLNGKHIMQHRGAFGAFSCEITNALSASGRNVIAIRVSNAPESDVAPLSGDFNVFGGLYRHVDIIRTPPLCFAVTDHASPGVTWLQSSVNTARAELDVTAQISNATHDAGLFVLTAYLCDAAGKKSISESQTISITPSVTAPYRMRLTLPQPHLWDGLADPYLYRGVVELRRYDGTLLDVIEQPLGLRSYRVDPDLGFFLNGRPYHLHGVNRHQDRWNKGWAISEADMREDIGLIKELGCTAIRCAHYQHSDYFYELCDSLGVLVWAELPQVDEINPSPEFEETSRNQLLDLIRQNINHPSIFVWSLFNELWPGRPDPHRELQNLNIVAHGEDPTRPTIAATSTDKLTQMTKIPDLIGWNIYPGWYGGWGTKDSAGALLDRGKFISKSGGLCVSEYGAGANPAHHEVHPAQPKTDGEWHPEEWQNEVHEAVYRAITARPFVWGSFVWVMCDFTSASRHEGGYPGRNDKGLLTGDRSLKKDVFYFYKSRWSTTPTVYITSRRFTPRADARTDVKVYSNASSVELLVNGRSMGHQLNAGECIFLWKDLVLREGENRIEARGKVGSTHVDDTCVWGLDTPK